MTDSPYDDLSLIYEWNMADDGLEWFGDIDRMLGFEAGEFPRTIKAWAWPWCMGSSRDTRERSAYGVSREVAPSSLCSCPNSTR